MIGALIMKKMARASFTVIERRDLDKFMASWAEDAILLYPVNPSGEVEIRGKEAIREWYRKDWEHFPEMKFEIKSVCVENIFALGATNVISIEWTVKGKNKNQEEFSNSAVTISRIKNGKIIAAQQYIFDTDTAKRVWGGNNAVRKTDCRSNAKT